MSDPIADLITRIKNAKNAHHEHVIVPFSKFKKAILAVMQANGYVDSVEEKTIQDKKYLVVGIAESSITHIKRLSKPGQRIYVAKKDIPRPLRGLGLVIVSTPKGVVSGTEAYKLNCGGELICEVW